MREEARRQSRRCRQGGLQLGRHQLNEALNISALVERADFAGLLPQVNAVEANRLLNLVRWFHSWLVCFCHGCQIRTKPIARPDQEVTETGFITVRSQTDRVVIGKQVCRGQFQFVVVRQAWVRSGQTKAWYQGAGRVGVGGRCGSEPGRRRRRRESGDRQRLQRERVLGYRQRQDGRRCRTETD